MAIEQVRCDHVLGFARTSAQSPLRFAGSSPTFAARRYRRDWIAKFWRLSGAAFRRRLGWAFVASPFLSLHARDADAASGDVRISRARHGRSLRPGKVSLPQAQSAESADAASPPSRRAHRLLRRGTVSASLGMGQHASGRRGVLAGVRRSPFAPNGGIVALSSAGISIVVPNWNGRALLEKFLPSIVESARAFETAGGGPTE